MLSGGTSPILCKYTRVLIYFILPVYAIKPENRECQPSLSNLLQSCDSSYSLYRRRTHGVIVDATKHICTEPSPRNCSSAFSVCSHLRLDQYRGFWQIGWILETGAYLVLLQACQVLQQDSHQKAGGDIICPADLQYVLPSCIPN